MGKSKPRRILNLFLSEKQKLVIHGYGMIFFFKKKTRSKSQVLYLVFEQALFTMQLQQLHRQFFLEHNPYLSKFAAFNI